MLKRKMFLLSLVMSIIACGTNGTSSSYVYVSPLGSDSNPGTIDAPFQTIQMAANTLQPGDICIIRDGTYRETITVKKSGESGEPILFKAFDGEVPVIKGLDLVSGTWKVHKSSIYKTQLDPGLDIGQVFVDDQPMTWARWPNATFKDRWADKKWKQADNGSQLGNLIDPDLAKTGINWNGAIATLNTMPNWNKWTVIVKNHAKGKNNFDYSKALQWKQSYLNKAGKGSYFLSGKLEALDGEEEWFYDRESGELYLYLPEGDTPEKHVVEIKTRNYGFYAEKCNYVMVEGLHFFASTFNLRECHNSTIDNCHIRFPNVAPLLTELNMPSKPSIFTQMIGHHNTVRNCSIAYSPTHGIRMLGSYNVVENNLIYNCNSIGSLCYANIWMGSLEDNYSWEGALKYEGMLDDTVEQATPEELKNVKWGGATGDMVKTHDMDKAKPVGKCVVRHNTLFKNGNAVLCYFEQPDYDISYNHVFDGGCFCRDVSSLYSNGPLIRGTVIHHNWVKTDHKLCIRADDQSRNVTIHHNVMWGSHTGSLVVKGEDHAVYHNTTLKPNSKRNWGLNIQVWAEPYKPMFRKLWPQLPQQNANTPIWNNFTHKITDHHNGRLFPKDDPRLSNNMVVENPNKLLRDPATFDFRPKKGSLLIDAAKPIKGINDKYIGKAPDIGAYEYGGENWLPGYRNFVKTFNFVISKSGEEGQVDVVTAMPPMKATTVNVLVRDKNIKILGDIKLIFTPENWTSPQTIRFKILKKNSKLAMPVFELAKPYESGRTIK